MGRNVEIKARIESIADILPAVQAIATSAPQEIAQDDTFFFCSNGRLKLRTLSENYGQLVFYNRPDKAGLKECSYTVAQISEPRVLRDLLVQAYGALGRVVKRRILYMVDNTRVHLDNVEGLGEFLELEVVLSDDESIEDGMKTANSILAKLGISNDQFIDCAYVDLIAQKSKAKEA